MIPLPKCTIKTWSIEQDKLHIFAQTQSQSVPCPACGTQSGSVHSYYWRTVKDLPISTFPVVLRVQVKRFRCRELTCPRATFTEVIPGFLDHYARRTNRFTSALWHIGHALGGQAGKRLGDRLGYSSSRHTILRILRRHICSKPTFPRIIGIDDWAIRRGQRYGTIIVDLERRCVLTLLPDRQAATVAQWLSQFPTIQMVARDRSGEYAQGIQQGVPHAIQVADRWHLLRNLVEVTQRTFVSLRPKLKLVALSQPNAVRTPFPRTKSDEKRRQVNRNKRLQRYTMVRYLHAQGHSSRRIARILSISRGLVLKYIQAPQFPERQVHYVASTIDPYLPYLQQRLDEDCWNARQLWREIVSLGYPIGPGQVEKWVRGQRRKKDERQPPPRNTQSIALPQSQICAQLFFRTPTTLSVEEKSLLVQLRQIELLDQLYRLVQDFKTMIQHQYADSFEPWLSRAEQFAVRTIRNFAAGLRKDFQAVYAALCHPWSNGQTEGQVNRLKMIKRQMYGRAGIDLLAIRLLQPP